MSRPAKGTPEYDLWLAAIDVAIAAPWKGGQTVFAAKVPWETLTRLRDALEGVGIDWEAAKRRDEAIKDEVYARRIAEEGR